MSFHFTYKTPDFTLDGVYETETEARTAAGRNAATTYGGVSDVLDAEPNGAWYFYSTAPNLRRTPRKSDLERLKDAAFEVHDFFVKEAAVVAGLVGYIPIETITGVQNLEYLFHAGISAVLEGRLTVGTPLTTAQKITFAENALLGATDVKTGLQLAAAFPALIKVLGDAGVSLPLTSPIVYVNPSTGARMTAAQAVPFSGTGAGNINLQHHSNLTHLVEGAWIKDLTE